MSFRLYIMRHGDALMRAPKDSLRPLSRLGHDQAVQSATYLGSCLQDHKPLGLVLASPYLRAQETTNNVVEQLDYTGELITCNSITPDNSPDTVIKMLSQYESRGPVLMVSHQPLVSGLIGLLTTGNSYEGVSMGTASIACLEMPLVGVGLAELLWLKHSTL